MNIAAALKHKIASSYHEASVLAQSWKSNGLKLVFTNGCFDLIHIGHIHTLYEAKSFGDKLVVGLNSDTSVKRLKGSFRPMKDQHQRSHILAALEVVDLVVIFEEDTPLQLIEALIPDILVKGGDWSPDEIVGSAFVLQNGGAVKLVPYLEGYSSTTLEEKIIGSRDENKT